ncbi:MAG: hypothetical protein AAFW68_04775 [Pseudomonadota bacterium]
MHFTKTMQSNLETMLRLAWSEADALRADLADIDAATRAAKTSLANLPEGMRADAQRTRRQRLFVTLETLAEAKEAVGAKLAAKSSEMFRLERLIAVNAATGPRQAEKKQPAGLAGARLRKAS